MDYTTILCQALGLTIKAKLCCLENGWAQSAEDQDVKFLELCIADKLQNQSVTRKIRLFN